MDDKNPMIDKMQKATTELFVLSALMTEDIYPYRLTKDIKAMTFGLIEYSEAGLYPVISRLLNAQMISSYTVALENGRNRTYYHIEDKGRAHWRLLKNGYDQFIRISYLITEKTAIKNRPFRNIPEGSLNQPQKFLYKYHHSFCMYIW